MGMVDKPRALLLMFLASSASLAKHRLNPHTQVALDSASALQESERLSDYEEAKLDAPCPVAALKHRIFVCTYRNGDRASSEHSVPEQTHCPTASTQKW